MMARRKKKAPPLEYAGNRWYGCAAVTDDSLDRLEREIERKLPHGVRDLLRVCSGGRPESPFFESAKHRHEAVIGHVLLVVDEGPMEPQSVPEAATAIAEDSKRMGTSAGDLVPFAVDNGNAHYYCLDGEGRVVYRILHEPPGEERRLVADSLDQFLEGLEERPF